MTRVPKDNYDGNLQFDIRLFQVGDLWMYTESEQGGVIKDPCKGDSGGPLIVDNGGLPLLVGVLKVGKFSHAMQKNVSLHVPLG